MSNMTLSGAVGIGGRNQASDIRAVQTALNQLIALIPPTRRLAVDGSLGQVPARSRTVAAIETFQKKVVGLVRPDGRIDPNGRTHRTINQKLTQATASQAAPSATLITTLLQRLEQQEGRIAHMYLDTRGYVTVGVGHMIPDEDKATAIAFVHRDTGQPGTAADIRKEYSALKKRPYGLRYSAATFRPYTSLELTNSTIDQLTRKHIQSFTGELQTIYGAAAFSGMPDKVKLALYDMIFNLGMPKLKNGYPNFNRHIGNNDWAAAARESRRNGISDERNLYVRNLLNQAAGNP